MYSAETFIVLIIIRKIFKNRSGNKLMNQYVRKGGRPNKQDLNYFLKGR